MGKRKMLKETFQLSLTPFPKLSHPVIPNRSEWVMCPPSCKRIWRNDSFIQRHCLPEQNQDSTETEEGEWVLVGILAAQCLLSPSPPQVPTALWDSCTHPAAPSSPPRTALPQPTLALPLEMRSPHCILSSQRSVLRSATALDRKTINFSLRHHRTSDDLFHFLN